MLDDVYGDKTVGVSIVNQYIMFFTSDNSTMCKIMSHPLQALVHHWQKKQNMASWSNFGKNVL